MINIIKICPSGHILPESDSLGRTGEHNATVLHFSFFEELNGKTASDFRKELVAVNSQGSFKYELVANEFPIPAELTTDTELSLQVKLYDADELVFKSNPHIFNFTDSIDDSGRNAIQDVVDKAKEGYRTDLASSLEAATGEDHSGETWDELNGTVAGLPVLKEEQTQALGAWDLIKAYFADFAGGAHNLFNTAPKDEDGVEKEYTLPYIYTPKMNWNKGRLVVSTNLLEFGVDVSSAVNIGDSTTANTFQPLPKLQRLVLTGNANLPSLGRFMHSNSELKYLKMDTPSVEVLEANSSYYKLAFKNCSKLVTIDCEFDFTGQTSTEGMFDNCYLLQNLKIKPFTLTCSLNVSACKYFVHPQIIDNSLIAILNAIPNPATEGENAEITITYSNEAWAFGDGDLFDVEFISKEIYFNPETGLYSYEQQTEDSRKTTLYDAFVTDKGVTLAR